MMHYLDLQHAVDRLYLYRDELITHASLHTHKDTLEVV